MVSPWPQPLAVSGSEHKWNLGTLCTGATYSRGLLAYEAQSPGRRRDSHLVSSRGALAG